MKERLKEREKEPTRKIAMNLERESAVTSNLQNIHKNI